MILTLGYSMFYESKIIHSTIHLGERSNSLNSLSSRNDYEDNSSARLTNTKSINRIVSGSQIRNKHRIQHQYRSNASSINNFPIIRPDSNNFNTQNNTHTLNEYRFENKRRPQMVKINSIRHITNDNIGKTLNLKLKISLLNIINFYR